MTPDEYASYDAIGLAEAIRSGTVGSDEAVAAARSAIARTNPTINAVVHECSDACAADYAADGPFAGVPFLMKDLDLGVAGEPTSEGSRAMLGRVASEDSPLVRRFRAAGFRIVGKTNTPEFGIMGITEPEVHGPTRNPWNPDHTSGGSSGGAAAAVAARIVPAAHAGDGGGSIRIPSSHCGLFGLKPTRGRVTVAPSAEGWMGLVAPHVVTRSVRDSAAILDAIQGSEPGDPYSPAHRPAHPYREDTERDPSPLRIGLVRDAILCGTNHPDLVEAVELAASRCGELGHAVDEIELPIDADALRNAYFVIVATSVANLCARAGRARGKALRASDVERPTWLLKCIGERVTALEMVEALEAANTARRAMSSLHERVDIILSAPVALPPVRVGELSINGAERALISVLGALGSKLLLDRALAEVASDSLSATPNTQLWNLTGAPAMSVPTLVNSDRLPLGAQFAAELGREDLLFSLAGQLERAFPWIEQRPSL